MITYEISLFPTRSPPSGNLYANSPAIHPARYLSPSTDRVRPRQLIAPRPLSEFPLSDSARMLPASSHPIAPRNTTRELAEFLRSTAPPWYDPSLDPQSKPSPSIHKKSTFGFLRSGAASPTKPQLIHPNPIFLPETVIARTSINGKRYLHISLPTENTSGHISQSPIHASRASEDGDGYHTDEPGSSPNRSGSANAGTTSSAQSVTLQVSEEKPTLPGSRWSTGKSELSDSDTVDSYHSYLKNQKTEGPLVKGGARHLGKPRRPVSIDVAGRITKKDLQIRRRSNTPDNLIYSHDQAHRGTDRAYDASAISTAPNYKSVFIHSHGLPPRRSSITKTKLFLPNAHIAMAHESSFGSSLANRNSGSPYDHSRYKRTSAQSTDNTLAETIRSDTSSTDVESTPSLSNTPNSSFLIGTALRTPPRPGPAPTRALPSLPEGHDTSAGGKDHTASSSKHYIASDRSDFKSGNSSLRQTEMSGTKDRAEGVSSETLKVSRKSREERVRERKMRDLQSTRARRELRKSDGTQHQVALDNEDKHAEARNSHASATTSSSSSSGGRPRTSRRLSASSTLHGSTVFLPRESKLGMISLSPIMLVVEQEPTTAGPRHPEYRPVRKAESAKQLSGSIPGSIPGSHVHSRSPSPSLPSSDDDTARKRRITKKGSLVSSATTAAAFKVLEAGATTGKEMELEARLVALEKKNALLESALMAVLQSTAQIPLSVTPGSPQGEPSSIAQTALRTPPSLDALVQSLGALPRHDPKPTSG
ncbi:hypothetical protein GP486_007902 [Trichoglossum hirsutum]|uniref:Uncharacterized protein n=1 Tax=Trichoglossum hirsutum TaxID=265104 RepID=A0A9P8L7E7_9PEZI|nr:hypothetical protein GP486_007902 [Trichoglossum hirsutum]